MSHVSTGGYIEVIHIEVLWRFFQRLPFISQRLSLSFEVFSPPNALRGFSSQTPGRREKRWVQRNQYRKSDIKQERKNKPDFLARFTNQCTARKTLAMDKGGH